MNTPNLFYRDTVTTPKIGDLVCKAAFPGKGDTAKVTRVDGDDEAGYSVTVEFLSAISGTHRVLVGSRPYDFNLVSRAANDVETRGYPDNNPKSTQGAKKPPLQLVPSALTLGASEAMANGADKYGPYNWRENSVAASVYMAAALRHLMAWYDGEDNAQDSGVHHLKHAAAGLGILLDAMATGNLIDDRPLPGAASQLIEDYAQRKEAQGDSNQEQPEEESSEEEVCCFYWKEGRIGLKDVRRYCKATCALGPKKIRT